MLGKPERLHHERYAGCYLLHARPYRETSLLIRLFHREHGIISAVAKGAAASRKIQPFYKFSAKITGRSDLKTLVAPEEDGTPWIFSSHASLCALYANELILVSCAEQDGHPILYDAYHQLLQQLAAACNSQSRQIALRRFEQILFTDIGYALNYRMDADNCAIQPDRLYSLGTDSMFVAQEQGRYAGRCLLAIAEDNFAEQDTLKSARRLTRDLIQRCIGKQLNSWKLFS